MADVLAAALALVEEQGWHIFRMRLGHNESVCNGGNNNCKTVAFLDESWKGCSSNDPDVIRSWDWSRANAYGIDCGKSDLVVADEDPGDTWPFNGTRVHSSGRGKHHIYEDYIGCGNRASVAHYGVDVRGVGGLIIGPGSWHPHGEYAVLDASPVAPAPRELVEAAPGPSKARTADRGPIHRLDLFEALSRLEGVYSRMAATPDGQRNDMLNKLAGTAAGIWVRVPEDECIGLLSEERIQQQLYDSIPDEGDPEKSWSTIHSGWAHGLSHPVEDREEVDFFDRTPVLQRVRQAAHSRGTGSWSVLAALLGHVALRVPVGADLPPVVGAPAPLNLGFALVGDSGASKSSSEAIAEQLLDNTTPEDWVRPIGSGEGMIDAFYEMVSTGPNGKREPALVDVLDRRRMFVTDEGEALRKLMERAGTTLGGFLRTALTGGMLGTGNSIRTGNSRKIPKGRYRLVMIIGIHPDQADVLLDGEGNGLPQRFCWLPADDPTLPAKEDQLPAWPEGRPIRFPKLDGQLDYPDHIKAQVRQRNLDRRKGGEHRLRAHATLTQLKLAQLLAVLHGEASITDEWWELAGELSDLSLRMQRECSTRLGDVHQRKHTAAALAKDRAEEAVDDDRVKRAAKAILDKVREVGGEWVVWKEVRTKIAHRHREFADQAIDALSVAGQVKVEEYVSEKGTPARRLRYTGI